jgi:hypothetical protein
VREILTGRQEKLWRVGQFCVIGKSLVPSDTEILASDVSSVIILKTNYTTE